jgi:hypothetical protein
MKALKTKSNGNCFRRDRNYSSKTTHPPEVIQVKNKANKKLAISQIFSISSQLKCKKWKLSLMVLKEFAEMQFPIHHSASTFDF